MSAFTDFSKRWLKEMNFTWRNATITAPFFEVLSTSGLKHRHCSSKHMKVMKSCSHHPLQEPNARMPLDHLAASDPCIFSSSHCEPSPLCLPGFKAKIINHFLL